MFLADLPVRFLLVGSGSLHAEVEKQLEAETKVGRVIFTGGRDHLTHRLLDYVGTPQSVAIALAGAQALLCVLGFLLYDASIVAVFLASTAYVLLGVFAIAALEWPYIRAEARAASEHSLSPALAPARQESGS